MARHVLLVTTLAAYWMACFPGPLELGEDGTESTIPIDASDSGTAPSDSIPDGDGDCESDDECKFLDEACRRGTCDGDKCVPVDLTGVTCDDGDRCTQNDGCAEGVCAGQSYTCNDGLSCTDETCDGDGGCLPTLKAETCFIEGECFERGDRSVANTCDVCESGTDWTGDSISACDDQDRCTVDDQCQAGVCTGAAPDDGAEDWFSLPVELENDDYSHYVEALVPDGAGFLVLGYVDGAGTMADGAQIASTSTLYYLARYSNAGAMDWHVSMPGVYWARLLGTDSMRRAVLSLDCEGACEIELADGEIWPLPTEAEKMSALVAIDDGVEVQGHAVSTAPQYLGRSGSSFAAVRVEQPELQVLGKEASSVAFTQKSQRRHLGLVRHLPDGSVAFGGEAYLDDPAITDGGSTRLEVAGTFEVSEGTRLNLVQSTHPFFIGTTESPARFTGEKAFTVLIELGYDGQVQRSAMFLQGNDALMPSGLEPFIHQKNEGYIIAGTFTAQSVTFGEGTNAVARSSSQYYSWGGDFQGAGGEVFVAHVDQDLQLTSVAFVQAEAGGEFGIGARLRATQQLGGDLIIAVSLEDRLFENGAPISGGMFMRLNDANEVVWRVQGARGLVGLIATADNHPMFIAGNWFEDQLGIGPSALELSEALDRSTGWVQRINSAGQLTCGLLDD